MPKAYRYHRFSTAEQDEGTSLDRQRKATKRLCEKHGWDIQDPPLEDKGLSAWKGDHLRVGELGRFADRVAGGEIEPGSILVCGSAWKKDPGSGVIGVEKGPLIPVV